MGGLWMSMDGLWMSMDGFCMFMDVYMPPNMVIIGVDQSLHMYKFLVIAHLPGEGC